MDLAREEIGLIADSSAHPTFENTIEALENAGRKLDEVSEIFFNLNSAETSDEMQALAVELSPMLTDYGNEIMQNVHLFERVKTVKNDADIEKLDPEQQMLLEKTYKGFVRNGAELTGRDKDRYNEISKDLAMLSLKFSENLLAETNAFEMHITDESMLAGLPENIKEAAAQLSKEHGKDEGWMFNLHAPSCVPFMEYADNRELREQLLKAY